MLMLVALVMGIGQMACGEDASSRDQLRSAVQGICPVSGKKLGSMGTPVKVQVGQETVFLCCQGCLQGKISAEHWATIHANMARAQGKCPVMEKTLPASPKWTIVEGQVVFVCCPPCTQKIAADPATYLQKVDALYSASLAKR
jgi:hypothetical protein